MAWGILYSGHAESCHVLNFEEHGNPDMWKRPFHFSPYHAVLTTVAVPCFLPWKESLHLSHSHPVKILVCSCLEMWCWEYLQSCFGFAENGETFQLPSTRTGISWYFHGSFRETQKKWFPPSNRFIHCHHYLVVFFPLYSLFQKPFPQMLYWDS